MSNLIDLFKSMNSRSGIPLRDLSIKSYVQKINALSKLCFDRKFEEGDLKYFLENQEKVIEKIKTSDLKSKKDYITPVVKLLFLIYNVKDLKYQDAMASFKTDEMALRKQNVASKSEVERSLPLEVIMERLQDFKCETPKDYMYKAIVSLYFGDDKTCVFRNDLPLMKLANSRKKVNSLNPEFNYITMRENHPIGVLMCRYKTQNTFGKAKFPLCPSQQTDLLEYFKNYNKECGDYAFTVERDIPYTKQRFLEVVMKATLRVLQTPLNVDLIRKIIATHYYQTPLRTMAQDESNASRFLHSVTTNREYCKPEFVEKEDALDVEDD